MDQRIKKAKVTANLPLGKDTPDLPQPPGACAERHIRILIADDHAIVLEGLIAMIGRQPDMTVVGQASNGEEAVSQWSCCKPDISLLDLRMPILDGVDAIDAIR